MLAMWPLLLLVAAPPPVTLATCDDPAARKQLLADNAGEPQALVEMRRRAEAAEQAFDRRFEQFAAKAKLSGEERGRLALSFLEAPGFDEAMKEGFAAVEAMVADMSRMTKDEQKNCRVLVSMWQRLPVAEEAAGRQWRIMHQALEAEAQRRGITLDP